jgi:hypothetical protein
VEHDAAALYASASTAAAVAAARFGGWILETSSPGWRPLL